MRPLAPLPGKKPTAAIVVVDMKKSKYRSFEPFQKFFCFEYGGYDCDSRNERVVQNIVRVIEKTPPLPVYIFTYMKGGKPAVELDPRIAEAAGSRAIFKEKIQYGAFTLSGFPGELRSQGISTVALMGFDRRWCVLQSIYGAISEGFRVVTSEKLMLGTSHSMPLGTVLHIMRRTDFFFTLKGLVKRINR